MTPGEAGASGHVSCYDACAAEPAPPPPDIGAPCVTDRSETATESERHPVTPEVLDAPAPETEEQAAAGDGTEQVSRPTKLIRIASMVRSLLDEARRAPLDDAGRRSLRAIHEKSISELEEILSDDLKHKLAEVTNDFQCDTPSESELRIAQAQLVGWLEGLFHGIQATLFTQQMQAQRQLEEMRDQRALQGPQPQPQRSGGGLYL